MLRHVNLEIDGMLTYIEDGATGGYRYTQNTLESFLSTRVPDWRTSSVCEDYVAFAKANGPVGVEDWGSCQIPANLTSFAGGLDDAVRASVDGLLYCEPVEPIRAHTAIMRDLTTLHVFKLLERNRTRISCRRLLANNTLRIDRPRASRPAYLFHASTGIPGDAETEEENRQLRISSRLAGYLGMLHNPFCYVADSRDEEDNEESRIRWLDEHCATIINQFEHCYRARALGKRDTLLLYLQDALAATLRSKRPVQFCVLCGKAAQSDESTPSMAYHNQSCRLKMARGKDSIARELAEYCGCDEERGLEMLAAGKAPTAREDRLDRIKGGGRGISVRQPSDAFD